MKKILFGSASAILAVVGLSAFKTTKNTGNLYYWFDVKSGVNLSPTGSNPLVTQISFVGFTTTPSISACTATPDLCIVGYSISQIKHFNGVTPTALFTNGRGVVTAPKTQGKSVNAGAIPLKPNS